MYSIWFQHKNLHCSTDFALLWITLLGSISSKLWHTGVWGTWESSACVQCWVVFKYPLLSTSCCIFQWVQKKKKKHFNLQQRRQLRNFLLYSAFPYHCSCKYYCSFVSLCALYEHSYLGNRPKKCPSNDPCLKKQN